MRLTAYSKKLVAHAMFDKGKHFLAAAVLLLKQNGHPEVVRHLLAQGLEVIQKGLLLAKDYDRYQPRLKYKLGHSLVRGSNALRACYGFRPLQTDVLRELQKLSAYYEDHLLRYGTIEDLLGAGGRELAIERVARRTVALVRFGNRLFSR